MPAICCQPVKERVAYLYVRRRWQRSVPTAPSRRRAGPQLSFDVGEDTGSPVVDEYDAKMPFEFSGKLNKVEIDLGADLLTPAKRGELEQLKSEFAYHVQ
jgi:hypothetical protein